MATRTGAFPWKLLKGVSRSFYVTLRLLPHAVREPISLAYLLARLSDTAADGAHTQGEHELLARRSELIGHLERSPDRAAIEKVWLTIREGQAFDTERFARTGASPLSPAELDHYTYLVAGCVGEFWTRLCSEKLPGFASVPDREMLELGIRFGKGLQLVNILRDRSKDASLGRCYIAAEGIPTAFGAARANLADANKYCNALRSLRLRAACRLPVLLAGETLNRIEADPSAPNTKVPRWQVWLLLLKALTRR